MGKITDGMVLWIWWFVCVSIGILIALLIGKPWVALLFAFGIPALVFVAVTVYLIVMAIGMVFHIRRR